MSSAEKLPRVLSVETERLSKRERPWPWSAIAFAQILGKRQIFRVNTVALDKRAAIIRLCDLNLHWVVLSVGTFSDFVARINKRLKLYNVSILNISIPLLIIVLILWCEQNNLKRTTCATNRKHFLSWTKWKKGHISDRNSGSRLNWDSSYDSIVVCWVAYSP